MSRVHQVLEVPGERYASVQGASWVELIRGWAEKRPEARAYLFLEDGETEGASLSYAEVDRQARAVAALLQRSGGRGERALLLYPPGLDFIAAFLGCLYAGAVAVPAYPPRAGRGLGRLQAILESARPAFALTTRAMLPRLTAAGGRAGLEILATDGLDQGLAEDWEDPQSGPETPAFLQYTSGSTALPKGVVVTHGNLLHNESLIQAAFRQSERSVVVGWLPLYHDMGLIGNVLQPLYCGATCVLMSPLSFLQSPWRWLRAISHYRATTSGGPNFAYELCLRKIPAERRGELDLGSWELAFNGAEPVQADTLERFAEAFAPAGFRRQAFYPCYGLAEATLFVSGGEADAPPEIRDFEAAALERGIAAPAAGSEGVRRLVSCGRPAADQRVAVVDPESGEPLPAGRVGEIWIQGSSVAAGYWDSPEATGREFRACMVDGEGPFLRTGDLGFLDAGELFVTGRLKDLIILRGRNLYPQDIELTAERSHPALRSGGGAAFSVDDGEERLVVVHEIERRAGPEHTAAVAGAVRRAVAQEHEAQVWEVVLIREATLPKTSSGKVQRSACRALYQDGGLAVVGRSRLDPAAPEEVGAGNPRPEEPLWAALRGSAAAVLGVAPAALDDDQPLTALGLDSLGAVELKHRLETELGLAPSLADLLGGATLADLAGAPHVASGGRETAAETGPPVLSHGLRALWFLDQMASGDAYVIAGAGRVRGALDGVALRRACERLLERHPSLRTRFAEREGDVRAWVEPGLELGFQEESCAAEELKARLREEAGRPFDLGRGPLMRVSLFHLAADEHVVLLVVHHIAADLWSMGVLVRELAALYGGAPEPVAPASTHAAWALREERRLAGPEGERLWDYWRHELSGPLPRLDLPTDRPRSLARRHVCGSLTFRAADPARTLALKALGRARGATLYMTLLAGFEALLQRYTGQEDFLLGSPTVGRDAADLAGVVGYFVNPVVLRADLSGDPGFEDLLGRVRARVLGAFEHQSYPLSLLTERLQPDRGADGSAVFQVMFSLQAVHSGIDGALAAFALNLEGARLALGPLVFESVPLARRTAQFDLTLATAELNGEIWASCEYDRDLFEAETIERLAERFGRLLSAVAERPELRLSELPPLGEEERRQLAAWSAAEGPAAGERTLAERIEEQARRRPEAVAVVFPGGELTYGELERRADCVAAWLRERGVGPGTVVGLCLERSPELIVGLYGTLKAGATYLPLDPRTPRERLDWLLEDSGAPVVLTRSLLAGIGEGEPGPRPSGPGLDGLLYTIYTSGSTGRPKAAGVYQRAFLNLLRWYVEDLGGGGTDEDRYLLLSSFSFDLTQKNLFAPLVTGGRLVLGEEPYDPARLATTIEREGVTRLTCTPSAFYPLLETGDFARLSSLRMVALGGEPVASERLAAWRNSAHCRAEVVNSYGPTECTDIVAWHRLAEVERENAPAGRPVPGARLWVAQENLDLTPVGVAGQLWIGGLSVGLGYPRDAALTAAKFRPDPFSGEPGARIYATGDRARWLATGDLEYLGRLDQQVKVRGFRIEPGEVEAALRSHPAVAEAVVTAPAGPDGGRRLVAYVVPRPGLTLAGPALREHLAERLPPHLLPSLFIPLEWLPLTSSGKVDRRALPEPAWEASSVGQSPRTPVEELLVGIWAEVLGLERVGVEESFFELGGHSLLATRVVSRARALLGAELSVRDLFEAPTVESLARRVTAAVPPEPMRVERPAEPPLSFAQERLWFLDQLDPGSAAYNMPAAVRLLGPLQPAALAAALERIVARHEALRTRFESREGRPMQVIEPAVELALKRADAADLEAALAVCREEASRPFDLTRAPLVRACLLRLSEEDWVFQVTMHHVVSDGWSLGVFVRELAALYEALSMGQEPALSPLPLQYADVAVWQRGRLAGAGLEGELSWWKSQLAGSPPVLELPLDHPRPAVQRLRGGRRAVAIPAAVGRNLERLARSSGATPYMVLLAGFAALLGRHAGQEDVVVGTPVAGRTLPETEELIGLFVNTLALRVDLSADPGFGELLGRVRERVLSAFAHQEVPFERLVEELSPERSLSHSPVFQALFTLQTAPLSPGLPGLELRRLEVATGVAKFDLSLDLSPEPSGGYMGWLEYDRDLFEAETIERLAERFGRLLSAVAERPELRLSELPPLGEEERRQLAAWSAAEGDYPRTGTLHGLFSAQARRTPEKTAVAHRDEALTYRELDKRSERLAQILKELIDGREPSVSFE